MSDATPWHSASTHTKPANGFVTLFIPGLLLGLVVGGLAGAYLAPLADGPAKLQGAPSNVRTPSPSGPRDGVPTPANTTPSEVKPSDTSTAPVKPEENKPAEAKPAEAKPTEPKPADPKPTQTP
jgi:hypothetical protein